MDQGINDTAKRCRGGGSSPGNTDANGISLLVTWRVADDETNTSGANLWVATVVITPSSTAVSPGGSNPEPVPPGVSVPITIPAPTGFQLTPGGNGITVQWDDDTNVAEFRFVLYEGSPTQRIFPAVLPWRYVGTNGDTRNVCTTEVVNGESVTKCVNVPVPNTSINFATYRSHLKHDTEYTMQLKSNKITGTTTEIVGSRTKTTAVVVGSDYAQLGFRTPSPLPYSSVAVPTSVEDEELPEGIALAQNYPNPFNPVTTIKYSVQAASHVSLSVYDMTGQQIETLVDGVQPKGTHSVAFDANGLPTGTYVYRLTTGAETLTRIMTLVR